MDHAHWEKFRTHAFKVIEPHIDPKKAGGLTKYDWMPIPGDPTKEELKKINEEQKQRQAQEFKKIYDERLKAMANAGMNVQKTA